MQTFLQDLKYALRMLRKNPAFTTVAILTLAIGIGANSAIFSVVNSVLLRPLPYRQPGQLVRVYSEFPTMQLQKFWLSPPELFDIQHDAKSWEAIGAWAPGGQNVGTESEPLRVTSAAITRSLIDVLGVQPERGRNFTEEEDRNGGPSVAIISHGLWQKGFGGASDIIGKQIQVNATATTVVGVMPANFAFPPGSNDQVELLVASRRERKIRGHDTDDGGGCRVDLNLFADDVTCAAETLLPESVRNDGDAWST